MIHNNMELESHVLRTSFPLLLLEQSLFCQMDHYAEGHRRGISNLDTKTPMFRLETYYIFAIIPQKRSRCLYCIEEI